MTQQTFAGNRRFRREYFSRGSSLIPQAGGTKPAPLVVSPPGSTVKARDLPKVKESVHEEPRAADSMTSVCWTHGQAIDCDHI